MAGNEGSTNALGYIDVHDPDGIEGAEDVGKHAIYTRIQPNLKIGQIKNQAHIKLKAQSNCWICEGWTEFKFNYIPKSKVDTKIQPVALHVSCDNYEPHLLAESLGGDQEDKADKLAEKLV